MSDTLDYLNRLPDGRRKRMGNWWCQCKTDRICPVHDCRSYQNHYWHRLSNLQIFVPIVCLLCGYEGVENDIVFSSCPKREPE